MAKRFQQPSNLPPARVRSNGHARPDEVLDIEVEIDKSKILIGDVRLMARLQRYGNQIPPDEFESLLDFMDKVCVGGVDQYPVDAIPSIMDAIFTEINQQTAARRNDNRNDGPKNLQRRQPPGRG